MRAINLNGRQPTDPTDEYFAYNLISSGNGSIALFMSSFSHHPELICKRLCNGRNKAAPSERFYEAQIKKSSSSKCNECVRFNIWGDIVRQDRSHFQIGRSVWRASRISKTGIVSQNSMVLQWAVSHLASGHQLCAIARYDMNNEFRMSRGVRFPLFPCWAVINITIIIIGLLLDVRGMVDLVLFMRARFANWQQNRNLRLRRSKPVDSRNRDKGLWNLSGARVPFWSWSQGRWSE